MDYDWEKTYQAEIRIRVRAHNETRQALWDVYRTLGFGQDGPSSHAAVNDLENVVRRAATEFRQQYDELLERA